MHIYFSFKKKMFSNKNIGGWGAIDWEAIVLGGNCPGAIVLI
jgi:hypothetical protein